MKNARTVAQILFRVFVRPAFPLGQWLAIRFGAVKGPPVVEGSYKRQRFLVGILRPGVTVAAVRATLLQRGFFMNRVAYIDPGQVLSMRRLDDKYSDRQYHVRVFEDGEVRGHYEFTPEDHPIAHLKETLFEARADMFREWLAGLIV